jgi:hypothetical protein
MIKGRHIFPSELEILSVYDDMEVVEKYFDKKYRKYLPSKNY